MLVLLGVVAVLVAPRIGGSLASAKLKTETRNILSVLRVKRSEAISAGSIITVTFDEEGRSYSVNGEDVILPEGTFLFLQEGLGGARRLPVISAPLIPAPLIPGPRITENSIDFYPDGSTSGAYLCLRGAASAYFIQVDWLSGEVSLANAVDRDTPCA